MLLQSAVATLLIGDSVSVCVQASVRTSVHIARTPAQTRTNSNDISESTPERNLTNVTSATCDLPRATVSRYVNPARQNSGFRSIETCILVARKWNSIS